MTFAKALARIEKLRKIIDRTDSLALAGELEDLLWDHADSIVQLGKIAKEMREDLGLGEITNKYDKIMNGEEV